MGDRETELPKISVVIASWSGKTALVRCLESLLPQVGAAEIIVAYRGLSDPASLLGSRFPGVRFLQGDADASVFLLRSLGVREAHGSLIALLEDHAAVHAGWMRTLVEAHARGAKICGGPIGNDAEASGYDWALYFVEYGIYLPPMKAGPTHILSGVNIAYDRDTLLSCREVWDTVFYETDVNAALVRAGHHLEMLPEAGVTSRLRMRFGEAMAHLFTGGQHFGAFRQAHAGPFARVLWKLAAPLVLIVLLLRIVRLTAARQPACLWQIARGLPWLLLLLGAWSVGEVASSPRTRK